MSVRYERPIIITLTKALVSSNKQMSNRNRNFILGLVVVFLLLLGLNALWGKKSASRELVYSDFIQRVSAGQVKSVSLQGWRIDGVLRDGERFFVIQPKSPSLTGLLRKHDVLIQVLQDDNSPWWITLFFHWGPLLFIVALWIFLMRRMQGGGGGKLFALGKSRAKRVDESGQRKVTFADVAGIEEVKHDLQEIVEYLKKPDKFQALGGRIPRGVLMVGPPGVGKTLLARAVAGEADAPFFSISGSDFVEMFVGVGASRVRDLFREARKESSGIIFIDEIDAVGRKRGSGLGSGHDEREQTLNQLLVEMDGFEGSERIIVMAATNRPDVLDPALLRPGRFDRNVMVSLPDAKGRAKILQVHAKKVTMAKKANLLTVARGCPGFSGADLRNLVNEAALCAARRNLKSVGEAELNWARDRVMMGPERRGMIITEEQKKNTAYHEAGHALMGALLPKADPVHKITIIPRGQAMGLTSFLPVDDVYTQDRDRVVSEIMVAMGGRAAEEVVFGERTTGASDDLRKATRIARNMVTQWGMSDTMGPICLEEGEERSFLGRDMHMERAYGEKTALKVDQEVSSILKNAYDKVRIMLTENLETLHAVAKDLLEKETLDGDDLKNLLKLNGTVTASHA